MAGVFVVSTCRKTALQSAWSTVVRWETRLSKSNDAMPLRLWALLTPKLRIYPTSACLLNDCARIPRSFKQLNANLLASFNWGYNNYRKVLICHFGKNQYHISPVPLCFILHKLSPNYKDNHMPLPTYKLKCRYCTAFYICKTKKTHPRYNCLKQDLFPIDVQALTTDPTI